MTTRIDVEQYSAVLREGAERAGELATAREQFVAGLRMRAARDWVTVPGRLLHVAADLIELLALGRAEATERALDLARELGAKRGAEGDKSNGSEVS